jgi:hypothetical protein
MRSFIDGCLCPLLFVAFMILLWTVMVVGCQANPVPETRLNPYMTEDDVVALMYRWKIGVRSSIRVKGRNPRPCVRITWLPNLGSGICYYHIGVDFGCPYWAKLPDGQWYEMNHMDGANGFMDMGMGRTLEAAIRNAAYYNMPQAEKDEVLRSK